MTSLELQVTVSAKLTHIMRDLPAAGFYHFVSITVPFFDCDLLQFYSAHASRSKCFFWNDPGQQVTLVGIGCAHEISCNNGLRFFQCQAELKDSISKIKVEDPSNPLFYAGFSFDALAEKDGNWRHFPASSIILPQFLLRATGDGFTLSINIDVRCAESIENRIQRVICDLNEIEETLKSSTRYEKSPSINRLHNDLTPEKWKNVASSAIKRLSEGALQKVVLARKMSLHAGNPFQTTSILRQLLTTNPQSYVFSFSREGSHFLGATPERLVSLSQRQIKVTALAGTSRRGANTSQDLVLGNRLLGSQKDRHEHNLVVESIANSLRPLCTNLDIPQMPQICRLREMLHLYTPISGVIQHGTNILDLVAKLHPTPAVGGINSHDALRFIRENECMDRGWYAGPIGWLNGVGEGEFAVALRSALIRGKSASVFAGCGLVVSSNPDNEFEETRLKMRTMLSALGVRDEIGAIA